MASEATSSSERVWQGLPVSTGVAHAAVHVLKDTFDEPEAVRITVAEVDSELARLRMALKATRAEIEQLKQVIMGEGAKANEADGIFDAHLLILEDASLLNQVERTVRNEKICVDAAYYRHMARHMDALRGLDDPYLRERFLDIKDVIQRMMRHLRGELRTEQGFENPVIIVSHDLTPSDTVSLDRSRVLGFATETGSANSHAAIIAKSLGLPAVVRLHGICDDLHTGDTVLLDGHKGLLIQRPTAETLARYRVREEQAEKQEDLLHSRRDDPAITADGRTICVAANAEFLEELEVIRDSGAEEVGLFRTEFLYLENPGAEEEEIASLYSSIVSAVAPRRVIFRTLDLGGDKIDPLLAQEPEPNPFLGWRGIRVSLERREFFMRQLRALLRASTAGRVGIMFPMISGVEEVLLAKSMLVQCSEELRAEGVMVPEEVEVGAMIEVPSAAVTADLIAPEVDFLSLGTNDLIQYSIAVDRVNERVSGLYQPTHPAILRMISQVVKAAHESGIRASICGEMAADVTLAPLLVGSGLDELSVATSQVARVKHAVRQLNSRECEELTWTARNMLRADDILTLSRSMAERCYPELLI